jgi:hypothetical protein
MQDQPRKKKWQKPELIVLVRSRPEKAVLKACKELLLHVDKDTSCIDKCSGDSCNKTSNS